MHASFPEEMNRVLASRITELHFAATEWAADNLLREGIRSESIAVTGNTGIDAVLSIYEGIAQGRLSGLSLPIDEHKKLIVVTAHRRESFGDAFVRICEAISALAQRGDVLVVWPVHRNPNVQDTVHRILSRHANVLLVEPVDYLPFVDLMRRAYLLITDSGGVQEKAPRLESRSLCYADKTERPEAVRAGTVKLVGTNRDAIIREATRLLDDRAEYDRMAHLHNPYGDGKASGRIADRILSYLHPA